MSSIVIYGIVALLGLWALALTCGAVWLIKQIGIVPAMLILVTVAVLFGAQEIISSRRDRKRLDDERRKVHP